MNNYYFDMDGIYTHSLPAYEGTEPPANAVRVEPPHKQGCVSVLNEKRDGWSLVEDHRGEQGFVDEEFITIAAIGPLPSGWSNSPPEVPDTRTPVEKRQAAYLTQSDPILAEAQGYQARVNFLETAGDTEAAKAAQANADERMAAWWEAVKAIQTQHPD